MQRVRSVDAQFRSHGHGHLPVVESASQMAARPTGFEGTADLQPERGSDRGRRLVERLLPQPANSRTRPAAAIELLARGHLPVALPSAETPLAVSGKRERCQHNDGCRGSRSAIRRGGDLCPISLGLHILGYGLGSARLFLQEISVQLRRTLPQQSFGVTPGLTNGSCRRAWETDGPGRGCVETRWQENFRGPSTLGEVKKIDPGPI
jgi:hypothetical protein